MYLDYAEAQAERRKPMYMKDWEEKLNSFLQFNERDILKDAGKVSKKVAETLALEEYEKFSQKRLEANSTDDFELFLESSDFKDGKK
jgi:hypothetical protein